jgi:hypothetical protein
MIGSFTEQGPQVTYIPNLRTKRVKKGCHKTKQICNDMDELEAERQIKQSSACNDL